MKKPIKKLISIMLSLMLVFSSTLVVFAEDTEKLKEVTTEAAEQVEEIVEEEKEELPEEVIEVPEEETETSDEKSEDEELPEGEIEEEIPEEEDATEEEADEEEIDSEEESDFLLGDILWIKVDLSKDPLYVDDKMLNENYLYLYEGNVIAYYTNYTLTFENDAWLNNIYFGRYENNPVAFSGDIVIDLNGHDVHIGPKASVYSNATLWDYMAIYCNYDLKIIDTNKSYKGVLYNAYDEGYISLPIYANGDLLVKDVTLNLYNTVILGDDIPGIINARKVNLARELDGGNLIVESGVINIKSVIDPDSMSSKAGIYAGKNVVVDGGYINCSYAVGTVGIYAEQKYEQNGGIVNLSFDSTVLKLKSEYYFTAGIAVAVRNLATPILLESEVNSANPDVEISGGYLNICMGYLDNINYSHMDSEGITALGDIDFTGNAHIKINSLGTNAGGKKVSNDDEPPYWIVCVDTVRGNLTLDGFVDVKCSIGDAYGSGVIAGCLYSQKSELGGDIYIGGRATFNGNIGNLSSVYTVGNISAYHSLTITDNATVNAKIGDVSNGTINAANLHCEGNESGSIIINGQAKVNASLGDIENSGYGFNILCEGGYVSITNNTTVNVIVGDIYNMKQFINIGTYNSIVYIGSRSIDPILIDFNSYAAEVNDRYVEGTPTVNAYINRVRDVEFCNICSNGPLAIIGGNVNTKIGDIFVDRYYETNAGDKAQPFIGSNFASLGESNLIGIYVADNSHITSTMGDVYYLDKEIGNKVTPFMGVSNFQSLSNVNFYSNSSTTITIGDLHDFRKYENSNELNIAYETTMIYGVRAYNNINVSNNATLNVNGGYGGALLGARNINIVGGNTYLNASSSATAKRGERLGPSALIYVLDNNKDDQYVRIVEGGSLYGYNMLPNYGYGIIFIDRPENKNPCYLQVDKNSEVVLDVLSEGNEILPAKSLEGETEPGYYHLFVGITLDNKLIESRYTYGSPYITGLYGTYSDDPELLYSCKYVMFSYRPYIIPDFDDDDSGESSSDSKHVVPNTGVYY